MAKFYTPTKLSENMHKTPEGFLVCVGVPIGRTGKQVYGKGEIPLEDKAGIINVMRESEDVFHPATLASFEGKPITLGHPINFVDPTTWSMLSKGHAQNVRKSDQKDEDGNEYFIADLVITDVIAIGMVESGLREVSLGYDATYEQTGDGEGKQSKIIGNHIALVDEGRAGPSYAINDRKWKGFSMTFQEKFKKIFGMTVDEALKEEKKDDKKDEGKDEAAAGAMDQKSYDELVKMFKDMGAKIDSMMKGKDEKKDDDKKDESADEDKEDKKDEKKDEGKDEEVNSSLEERIKQLETALKTLMEGESEDEESEEESEGDAEDDDFEESTLTGDTVSRAEILSPGLKKTKDMKSEALKAFEKTKEGKEILQIMTQGKKMTYDSASTIDMMFIAASEVMKNKRSGEMANTKKGNRTTTDSVADVSAMTPEALNKQNEAFWANRK